ncbi:MAG: hypothetical protein RSC92_02430 [Clostridia bacterium]
MIENEFEASVKEGYNAINIKFIRPDDVDLRIIERIISRLTREGLSVHIINSLNFRLSLYETVSSSEIIKTTYL